MANNISKIEFATANRRAAKGRAEGDWSMPLILAPIGQEVRIVRIALDEKTAKHLLNLGVLAGETITVLSSSGGSAVCRVKNGRLALDRQIAARIFVA